MKINEEIAIKFGQTLDKDQFELTKKLISDDCKYYIEDDLIIGPEKICNSYKQNMIEGRRKLDVLEWGESKVQVIDDKKFVVHFTDYLTHKNKNHVHKCAQILTFNNEGLINRIEHENNEVEKKKLNEFYKKVGLVD